MKESASIMRWKVVLCNHVSYVYTFFYLAQQPPLGQGVLIHEVSLSHTTTHHIQ